MRRDLEVDKSCIYLKGGKACAPVHIAMVDICCDLFCYGGKPWKEMRLAVRMHTDV